MRKDLQLILTGVLEITDKLSQIEDHRKKFLTLMNRNFIYFFKCDKTLTFGFVSPDLKIFKKFNLLHFVHEMRYNK